MAGRRGQRRRRRRHAPEVLTEALVWGAVAWVVAVGVMAWSGLPWVRVALVGAGLLLVSVLPVALLRGTGTRLRNLEALKQRQPRP